MWCDLDIWWMTLTNYRAHLLCYLKLCASFCNHRSIQTLELQSGIGHILCATFALSIISNLRDLIAATRLEILFKLYSNRQFSACMTLKFDGWLRNTIGYHFYTTPSCVHHFKSIGEFKLELQSGSAQFVSKSVIFGPCNLKIWQVTLKNNRASLPYYVKLCIISKPSVISNWSYSSETLNLGQNRQFVVPCNLEIR